MKRLNPKHIIISRTDNMGDVILTIPLVVLLKKKFPTTKITFLARNYVRAIVESCGEIDHFISWDEINSLSEKDAVAVLKALAADTIIHVLPKRKIARIAKSACIPNRIGTNRRLYHALSCNYRVKFSRSKSALHEAQLNLKLLSPFNLESEYSLAEISSLIDLRCTQKTPDMIQSFLDSKKFNLIIHPLTNGNTREWPIEYFCELIQSLSPDKFNILITGSAKERQLLQKLLLPKCSNATDLTGKLNLNQFLSLIQSCDGLVANSTGPLHIAAALGIKTLGIFPAAITMNPARWAPLGKQTQYMVIDKHCGAKFCSDGSNCVCIRAITPAQVKKQIVTWLN